jgi:hypothetical protein
MIKLSRTTAVAAAGGGVVASIITFGIAQDLALGANGNANPKSNSNANATPNPKTLEVVQVGSAVPAAPGVPGAVTIKVTNPNAQGVVLTQVTGSVTKVSRSTCDKSWFSIGTWSPGATSTVIAGRKETTVTLPVTFQNTNTNQDACKGVTFEFSIAATGRQA